MKQLELEWKLFMKKSKNEMAVKDIEVAAQELYGVMKANLPFGPASAMALNWLKDSVKQSYVVLGNYAKVFEPRKEK